MEDKYISSKQIKDICDLRLKYNRSCRDCIFYGTECKPLMINNKPQYNPRQRKNEVKKNGNY